MTDKENAKVSEPVDVLVRLPKEKLNDELSSIYNDLLDLSIVKVAVELLNFESFSKIMFQRCGGEAVMHLNPTDFCRSKDRMIERLKKLGAKGTDYSNQIEGLISTVDIFNKRSI